jgi:hypothetical protein
MPASSFNIQAPDSDSSAPASTIHGLDKSGTTTGDIGTPMTMPALTTTGSDDGAYYDPPRSY